LISKQDSQASEQYQMNAMPGQQVENDWFQRPLPSNIELGPGAYVESAFSFSAFASQEKPGLILGEAAGVYDYATFIVGPAGRIDIGPYTCLNASYLICNDRISIGAHCLVGWGAVLTDTWPGADAPREARRAAIRAAASHPNRVLPPAAPPRQIVVQDNVWIGFDAVILPGVRLGRGCIIGSRTPIAQNVPPYAVVAGDPPRLIRWLTPDDSPEARHRALREYSRDLTR
jgi:acetyltransferase-like isoleucine patch superfamily enzyme